uniref:Uncharacterized protein n=1 Tax=Solanum lycopersicum TaxID=4081 RepID=A0A3Q7G630_SOLLC
MTEMSHIELYELSRKPILLYSLLSFLTQFYRSNQNSTSGANCSQDFNFLI